MNIIIKRMETDEEMPDLLDNHKFQKKSKEKHLFTGKLGMRLILTSLVRNTSIT